MLYLVCPWDTGTRRGYEVTVITRSKGGTAERQVDIHSYNIPDLWHVYEQIEEGKNHLKGVLMPAYCYTGNQDDLVACPNVHTEGEHTRVSMATAVLDCWNLCHDLIRHIEAMEEEKDNTVGGWSFEDIITRAEEYPDEADEGDTYPPVPTEAQAKEIVAMIARTSDAEVGICWETIDIAIEDYFRGKEEELDKCLQEHEKDMKAKKYTRIVECLIKNDGTLRLPGCGGCDDQGYCSQLAVILR